MFTERAHLAVLFATQEAKRRGAPEVSALHLLAGLLLEDEGFAAQVLANHGVRLETLRAAALADEEPGTGEPTADPQPSATVQRAMERAEQEARWLERDHVGTEHVLLGLLHESGGAAIRLLLESGVSEADIRDVLVKRLRRRR